MLSRSRCLIKAALVGALALFLGLSSAMAAEPINLAGVYEFNGEVNGYRKQMYLTLDLINGTPDFTQVFTTKESAFKSLPKDFMNAKKLKKNFAGTSAPGFGKFREKFLFSNTSEFKLEKPRIVDGVIKADWTDASSGKGECTIIVNPDRSIQVLGLTDFIRDSSPDDVVLPLVEDRLPAGTEPYVTPPAVAEFVIGEYVKSVTKAKVASFDKDIEMQVQKAEQKGSRVTIEMRLRNNSTYEKLNLVMCNRMTDACEAIALNDKVFTTFSAQTPGKVLDNPAVQAEKGKWVSFRIIIDNVTERVDYFKLVKIDFAIAGGFFVDNPFTVIENLPVLQEMPASIKPGNGGNVAGKTAGKEGGVITDALCLDAKGPVAEIVVSAASGLYESIYTYRLNEAGELVSIEDGLSVQLGKDDIKMVRDEHRRPIRMTTLFFEEMGDETPQENVVSFYYDDNDRLLKEQHGEGADGWSMTYVLDADGKATEYVVSDAEGKQKCVVTYPANAVDKEGNWTSRTVTSGGEKTKVTRKITYRR